LAFFRENFYFIEHVSYFKTMTKFKSRARSFSVRRRMSLVTRHLFFSFHIGEKRRKDEKRTNP